MSLSTVFSSFYTSNTTAQKSYLEQSSAKQSGDTKPQAATDVYVASESYQFKASYTVYSDQLPAPKTEGSDSQAANTILNFIGNRLRLDLAEGATPEELSSRLSAGLEGFVDGYTQAYEQLSGMNFLNPYVEDAIETTYSLVVEGINALAADLKIASPVDDNVAQAQESRREAFAASSSVEAAQTETSAPSNGAVNSAVGSVAQLRSEINKQGAINQEAENLRSLISASSFDYRASESRSFNFSLTTQDGDTVSIRAAYDNVAILNGQTANYGDASGSEVSGSFRAASGFYLDIRGELDEDEYKALEELLGQVKQVSELFFSGDLEAAFQYATEMGFDESEIAEFSLRLRYQVNVVAEETYQQIAPPPVDLEEFDARDQRLMLISQFIQALEALRTKADGLGINGFSGKEMVESIVPPEDHQSGRFGLVQNYLSSLESLIALS